MRYLHTAIRVRDLDAALACYCGIFDFREVVCFQGPRRPSTIVFVAQPGDAGAQLDLVWYHDTAECARVAGYADGERCAVW